MNDQPIEPSARALADNAVIAANLREYADLLEQQGADGFRIAAYRRAGATLESLDKPVGRILAENGNKGLVALPGIGRSIAVAITEMIRTGRWTQLIPACTDQNPCAQSRIPMDMIFHGRSMSLFQASQHRATISS